MTAPVSYQVLDALKTRLQAITVVGGYNTDAGAGVFLGKRRVNQDQLDTGPVINVYDVDDEPDEEVAYGDEPIRVTMRIHVDALILDASEAGVLLAHEVMQDIFNATLTDQTVGGLALDLGYAGRTIEYPEPGGDTISVSMEFTSLIELPYGNI